MRLRITGNIWIGLLSFNLRGATLDHNNFCRSCQCDRLRGGLLVLLVLGGGWYDDRLRGALYQLLVFDFESVAGSRLRRRRPPQPAMREIDEHSNLHLRYGAQSLSLGAEIGHGSF